MDKRRGRILLSSFLLFFFFFLYYTEDSLECEGRILFETEGIFCMQKYTTTCPRVSTSCVALAKGFVS